MPSRSLMPGAQPRCSVISVLSLLRPLTPLGAERLWLCLNFTASNVLDQVGQVLRW